MNTKDAAILSHDASALGVVTGDQLSLAMLSASPDCVKLLDVSGAVSFINTAGLCAMEIDDFGVVSGRSWWDLWPDAARTLLRESVAGARTGRASRFQAFCPTAKGTAKWWDVSVTPVRGADGAVQGILSISRDVTDLHDRQRVLEETMAATEASLTRAQLLLREIDHRVKNSLSIIAGLLRIQARSTPSESARLALIEAAARVGTVARVHERLYRSARVGEVDLKDYLTPLCEDLVQAFRPQTDRDVITVTVAPIIAGPDKTVPIGLIVAELLTNATRHSGIERRSDIAVDLSGPDDAGHVTLTVEDRGKGLPDGFDPAASTGLGMRVVLAMVAQLEGTLTAGNRPRGGARFTVRFPLA